MLVWQVDHHDVLLVVDDARGGCDDTEAGGE